MIESAKEANFDILALTVDTITGGIVKEISKLASPRLHDSQQKRY